MWPERSEITPHDVSPSWSFAIITLVLLSSSPLVAVESSIDSLTMVVDSSTGGAFLTTAPGASGGRFLPNGSTVELSRIEGNGSGWTKVRSSQGIGWIRTDALVGMADTFMPSARDPGVFLPVPGPSASRVSMTLNLANLVVLDPMGSLGIPSGAGSFGSATDLSLVGVTGEGLTGPTATVPASGPPSPSTSTPDSGAGAGTSGDQQSAIIATAEESQSSPTGYLNALKLSFVALPSKAVLRRSVAVQLADQQGSGYGPTISAQVRDVGPWSTSDPYWENAGRPAAEALRGQRVSWSSSQKRWVANPRGKTRCNGAGMDISIHGWMELKPGLSARQAANHSGTVNWSFSSSSSGTVD